MRAASGCIVLCFAIYCFGQISSYCGSAEEPSLSEQAYLNATRIDNELPTGFIFNLNSRNIDMYNDTSLHYVEADWGGYNANHEYLGVSIAARDVYYALSAAELRKELLSEPGGWDAEPYDDLPGGVLESSHESRTSWIVTFWKSPYIYGEVQLVGDDRNGKPLFSDDFLRSECKRLAKLFYDRLPGKSSKYSELISVLKKYRPKLFGSVLNPKLTDDIISQALSEHEVDNKSGMEGATIALNRNMLSDIDEFWNKLKEPIPSWDKSLITTLEKDNWDKTMDYYYKILDKAYKYIKDWEDTGYDYEFPIPPPLGPAEWIMKYKDYLDKAEYLRDSYYLPAVSEDMYQRYKEKRNALGSDEAFEETIFESQTTWNWIKGSGWYAVRAAPEFAFMGDDNAAVEKLLLQRFENRYNIERLKDERDKMVKYPDYYINAIIHDYDSKILLISRTCDRILAE